MPKLKPNEAFEKTWDASMRAAVGLELQGMDARLRGSPAFVESQVANVKRLFAERRRIQKAIFDHLRGSLGKEREMVDFLSGDAAATLPLVLSGDLNVLHLVDNGHSRKQKTVGATLPTRLGIQGNVRSHDLNISSSSGSLALPRAQVGLLSDTGFALPVENRMPQTTIGMDTSAPSTFRGSHVIGATAGFNDVLRVFGGAGRTLHVVETPFVRAPLSVNDWGDHLSREVGADSQWRVQDVAPLVQELGTMRARLEFVGA